MGGMASLVRATGGFLRSGRYRHHASIHPIICHHNLPSLVYAARYIDARHRSLLPHPMLGEDKTYQKAWVGQCYLPILRESVCGDIDMWCSLVR